MDASKTLHDDGALFVIPKTTLSMAFQTAEAGKIRKIQLQPLESQTSKRGRQSSVAKSILLVLTVTLAMVVNTANSTSFTMAFPTIQREMHVQEEELQWIISAYPLSSGCLLLVCGRLADVYGRKKMFLIGSIILIAFTLGCSFANDVLVLEILRGFQGIGVAAQIPASLGILAHEFPPSRARSFAFAAFAAGAPIGGVFGSSVGGLASEFTKQTWRSACYVLAGTTMVSFVGGFFSISPDYPSEEKDKRVDWFGAFLVTAGLVQIVFVLGQVELTQKQWATPYIIATLALGVFLVVAFLFWQHYLEKIQSNPNSRYSIFTPPPLLKLSIWTRANGRLAAMMVVALANWSAFMPWLFWVQLYFQNYKMYSPVECIVRLIPTFVSGILCNAFVGLMAARVPIVWMLGVGTLSTVVACLLFAIIIPDVTYWAFSFPAICLGVLGADFVFTAGTLFIAKYALPHEQSVAGALFNTMTQLGTALGVTVSTTVYNSVSKRVVPKGGDPILLYRAAQWTACGFGILATIISLVAFTGVGVVGGQGEKVVLPSEHTQINDSEGSVERIAMQKPKHKVWEI